MKLLFSEAQPDYRHYIFPYAIWGFPEPGETPADLFHQGFLPSSRDLDRFYLCRQVRVDLRQYRASSENRRILRKGEGISPSLVARADFDYTPERRAFYKAYADARFGAEVMPFDRLDALFGAKITSHVLLFTDDRSGREVGAVTLYFQPGAMAYYYYSFYDLNYASRNLGMFLMTCAVSFFAERAVPFLYLGSCYAENALYKTQFAGAEFFNGVKWSQNLTELKHLVRRGREPQAQHLLESEEYRQAFLEKGLPELAAASPFAVQPST